MVQETGKISVKFIPQVAIDRKNPQSLDFVLDAVAKLIESLVRGLNMAYGIFTVLCRVSGSSP